MKSAKEMRTITNEFLENKRLQMLQQVVDYVEENLISKIEENASEGKSMITHSVNVQKVDLRELAKFLEDYGYTVKAGTQYPIIKIFW